MKYNIYTSADKLMGTFEWLLIAIDRVLLDKVVECYLKGINEGEIKYMPNALAQTKVK